MSRVPWKCPTGHPNVHLSRHAVDQMSARGYMLADIDRMLGGVDSRLVMEIITVLPRNPDQSKTSRRLQKDLEHARSVLKGCKNSKAITKWTEQVSALERRWEQHTHEQHEAREQRLLRHCKFVILSSALAHEQDKLELATTAKQQKKSRSRIYQINWKLRKLKCPAE